MKSLFTCKIIDGKRNPEWWKYDGFKGGFSYESEKPIWIERDEKKKKNLLFVLQANPTA